MLFFKIKLYQFNALVDQIFIAYVIFVQKHVSKFFSHKNKKINLYFYAKNNRNTQFSTFFRILSSYAPIKDFFFFYNFNQVALVQYYKTFKNFPFLVTIKKTFGEGFTALRGLLLISVIDALITDDEPLWEPLEWSLIQTWLLFIFGFAWIAENLITSRFGSYTGRDKRVWLAWYKTFWLIELCYIVSYGAAAMFVIVPFYYELTYNLTFIFSWWTWYTKIFFFKFISLYSLILLISNYLILNLKWLYWKTNLILIFVIFSFLSFLLYSQFIITFFAYFTDPLWYQKTRVIDYIQLSHEPLKWGWGPAKKDHFTYHKTNTVFWFKNDSPFAGAFLMFNFFIFLCLFFLFFYWVVLFRKTYATKEISFTLTVYCVSALKQFFYFFLLLFILIGISFIMAYWRFPVEFFWMKNANVWFPHLLTVMADYGYFLITIFF